MTDSNTMAPSRPSRPAALVTGGAKRIGAAIVQALARAGYAVVVHTRDASVEALHLVQEINASAGHAFHLRADLAISEAAALLVKEAAAKAGPLTLLVNNASLFERDEFGALDQALWERQFAVNLIAPVFLAEAFAAQAPEQTDCCVVNITDQRVLNPGPHFASYTLSKCALHLATRMLAQALAPKIRVNAVAPGPTLPSKRQSAETFSRQASSVPLGYGPRPEEIAEAVVFLSRARSITGQTIVVDGGQHLGRGASGVRSTDE